MEASPLGEVQVLPACGEMWTIRILGNHDRRRPVLLEQTMVDVNRVQRSMARCRRSSRGDGVAAGSPVTPAVSRGETANRRGTARLWAMRWSSSLTEEEVADRVPAAPMRPGTDSRPVVTRNGAVCSTRSCAARFKINQQIPAGYEIDRERRIAQMLWT